jgi:hypothetical protein
VPLLKSQEELKYSVELLEVKEKNEREVPEDKKQFDRGKANTSEFVHKVKLTNNQSGSDDANLQLLE